MDNVSLESIQRKINMCFTIYEKYSWLLNCYVLVRQYVLCFRVVKRNYGLQDFFTENHWNKILKNWQISLGDLNSVEISELLNYDEQVRLGEVSKSVWSKNIQVGLYRNKILPLSILALKTILISSSLSRKMIDLKIESPCFTQDEKLLKLFWKNVKAKKRHEISIMSKVLIIT